MDVLQKARELADALESSAELRSFRSAEALMRADPEAMKLLHDFRATQGDFSHMQLEGEEPSDFLTEQLEGLRVQLQKNPLIADYLDAQEKLGTVLAKINDLISLVLPGGGCTGTGCAGCVRCK